MRALQELQEVSRLEELVSTIASIPLYFNWMDESSIQVFWPTCKIMQYVPS